MDSKPGCGAILGPTSWLCLPLNSVLSITILRLHLVPKFYTSLLTVAYLVTWSKPAHEPKFPAYPWNTLDVTAEFPAFVSVDSLLTVNRAMTVGYPYPVHAVHLCQIELEHFQGHIRGFFCRLTKPSTLRLSYTVVSLSLFIIASTSYVRDAHGTNMS